MSFITQKPTQKNHYWQDSRGTVGVNRTWHANKEMLENLGDPFDSLSNQIGLTNDKKATEKKIGQREVRSMHSTQRQ